MSAPGRYVLLDVFTETPLQGNQLAVFADARELDARLMALRCRWPDGVPQGRRVQPVWPTPPR